MSSVYYAAREQAVKAAMLEAEREHRRLNSDLTRRVDIFRIIEDAGIWLMFRPLDHLYGVIHKQNNGIGVLINSQHPSSLQRYTAAHEYGHHILDHTSSFDDEGHIEGPRQSLRDLREIQAQVFAANFLMPIKLVNRLLRNMGMPLKPGQLTPKQAYLLALELGVSYRAAIYQLREMDKISQKSLLELDKIKPRDIKAAIGQGTRPMNTRADVWELEQIDRCQILMPHIDDELRINLSEIPSSGYRWAIDARGGLTYRRTGEVASNGSSMLELALDKFEPQGTFVSDDHAQSVASGIHIFLFRVLEPGSGSLRFVKKRPWIKEPATELEVFEVNLEIEARPTGEESSGLSQTQQPALAQAA